MKRVAKFYKVSKERFAQDLNEAVPGFTEAEIDEIYGQLKLPSRATKGSAGYDFHSPITFNISPGRELLIPTGIRVEMEEDWVLMLYPRSGLGFKYRLQLNNTVGVIDSDYFYADNEGHIMARITNDSKVGMELRVDRGMGFIQGVFLEYGLTTDDETETVRTGGFGSTNV